jgi:hypothetical protein
MKKIYRVDGFGSAETIPLTSLIRIWLNLVSQPDPEGRRKANFFVMMNYAKIPHIFDFLLNIWIEELDFIPLALSEALGQTFPSIYSENYKRVNCIQFFFLVLKKQINWEY